MSIKDAIEKIVVSDDIESCHFAAYRVLNQINSLGYQVLGPDQVIEIPVKSILEEPNVIEDLQNRHVQTDKEALGITSLLKAKNRAKYHLEMIDFDCEPSEDNLEMVQRTLLDLRTGIGYIVNSGGGFHFYGKNRYGERELKRFLERIERKPFVDEKWPENQIMQGMCVLRVTASKEKPFEPVVVAEYNPQLSFF